MGRPEELSLKECDLIGVFGFGFLVFGVCALSYEVYSPCIRSM